MIDNIEELKKKLNELTAAYDQGTPKVSDKEWDDLYFQLQKAEQEQGAAATDSPTQSISYEFVTELNKVEHNHKMLSLDKTKNIADVKAFINNHTYAAMPKMDGLTCSLRYLNGELVSAETRGNGFIGEDVTHNAKVIISIPKLIDYKDELVVDGEIICRVADFQEFSDLYANPRNFAAGSIRLLDARECAKRKLTFVAWDVIKGMDDEDNFCERLDDLTRLGFVVVPHIESMTPDFDDDIFYIKNAAAELYSYPIDGIVFKFNSVSYGKEQGETSHHFKNAIAYKFYDETYPSILRNIEWTMGRSGVLTPVAVFDPVDIEGSVVERASLHNINIMGQILEFPFVGQKIEVYKANQIIPQILKGEEANPSADLPFLKAPAHCPYCGGPTTVNMDSDTLICMNPDCEGKLINRLDHFCGKKGLDIKGLSKVTLEKLIDFGYIDNLVDIFKLKEHYNDWINKYGFSEISVTKILNSIDESRICTLEAFISSLGIPLIGKTASKEICKHVDTYWEFRELVDMHYDFSAFDGFADSRCDTLWKYDYTQADMIYDYLIVSNPKETVSTNQTLAGKTVVITGKLHNYNNRAAIQADIEARGGKVGSSVTKATTCLINNDNTSQSAKNLSALKLNIPILTEEEFISTYLTN